jgi:localization factor PodJL
MGLKKDTAEALFWYALAALQSDADAAKREAALSAALAPAIVAEVKARAGKWSPKQVSQEANIVAVADQAWQSPAAAEPAAGGTSEHKLESVSENADNPVHHVQQLLAGHGFNIGEADGKLGSRTVNAIRLFELQSGMKVTGKVSDELIEKLESAKAKPPA